MKKYTTPELEVIELDAEDIIMTSAGGLINGGQGGTVGGEGGSGSGNVGGDSGIF